MPARSTREGATEEDLATPLTPPREGPPREASNSAAISERCGRFGPSRSRRRRGRGGAATAPVRPPRRRRTSGRRRRRRRRDGSDGPTERAKTAREGGGAGDDDTPSGANRPPRRVTPRASATWMEPRRTASKRRAVWMTRRRLAGRHSWQSRRQSMWGKIQTKIHRLQHPVALSRPQRPHVPAPDGPVPASLLGEPSLLPHLLPRPTGAGAPPPGRTYTREVARRRHPWSSGTRRRSTRARWSRPRPRSSTTRNRPGSWPCASSTGRRARSFRSRSSRRRSPATARFTSIPTAPRSAAAPSATSVMPHLLM